MKRENKTKIDELGNALNKKREIKMDEPSAAYALAQETPPPSSQEAVAGGGEDLLEQIRSAEEEAKSHYDKLLRVMAEFENFKRRIAKEQEEQLKFANEKLLTELLPSLDDLDRVLDHVLPDAVPEVKAIAEGVELMRKSLFGVLERFGLKEVPALGVPFDPTRHEAIAVIESDAHEPGNVMALHRKGYWLGERLLRPAMVSVAKEKEAVS